jgi:hypothetical protein
MIDHALFPRDAETDPPIHVEWIAIKRFERGAWVDAPQMWPAEDFADLACLFEQYGGGQYRLEARAGGPSGRQHWTKKIAVTLPGASKPLELAGGAVDLGLAHAPAALAAPSGDNALLIAVMQMGQQSTQMMAQLMGTMMQSQTAMLSAVMGGQRGDQATTIKAVSDMAAASVKAQSDFYSAMAQQKTGGAGGELGAFLKGLERGEQQSGPSDEDELAATLGTVVDGFRTAAELASSGAIPPHPGGPIGATPAAPMGPRANGGPQ